MSDTADNHLSGGPEIVRRKFTLSKKKADEFQTLANEHYAGNRSAFLRSAAADHAHTLEGEGRNLLREILDEIKSAREDVDELQEALNENNSPPEQPSATETDGMVSGNAIEEKVGGHDPLEEDMWLVYQEIANAYPDTLCVDDLVSLEDLSETDVKHALIDLRARGKIVAYSSSGATEYRMATGKSK